MQVPPYFLGRPEEVCIATRDIDKTMEGLVKLGIGPWKVYTFDPSTVSEQTYAGEPSEWALKVAFAPTKDILWELIQPLWGPSIIADFLDKNDEGVQHISFDLDGLPWDQRIEAFASRGFKVLQSGFWANKVRFAFYDTAPLTGLCFESYSVFKDVNHPEPDYIYPRTG